MCLAGELVKELVATVKDENNRDNQLEEPQATAPTHRYRIQAVLAMICLGLRPAYSRIDAPKRPRNRAQIILDFGLPVTGGFFRAKSKPVWLGCISHAEFDTKEAPQRLKNPLTITARSTLV